MSEGLEGSGVSTSDSVENTGDSENSTPTDATHTDAPDYKGTKHRVKVDGKEIEVDYDDLVSDYQIKQASFERLQKASQKEKELTAKEQEVQSVMRALESGDARFIEGKVGKEKARELFEDYLIQQMEYDDLPESEKKYRKTQTELDEIKAKQAADEEVRKEREQDDYRKKAHADLDKEVGEALRAEGKKPSPRLVIRIVDEMIARINAETGPIGAVDAVKYAKKGILSDIGEYLPQLEAEELFKVLPKEVIEKIRKHEVQRVMGSKGNRRYRAEGNQQKPKVTKTVGTDQWFDNLESKFS